MTSIPVIQLLGTTDPNLQWLADLYNWGFSVSLYIGIISAYTILVYRTISRA